MNSVLRALGVIGIAYLLAIVIVGPTSSRALTNAERDWPQVQHQLQSPNVRPGASSLIPQTIRKANLRWRECPVTRCQGFDIHYYPVIYRVAVMNWDRTGCFAARFQTWVSAISAASARDGGLYRLKFGRDGKSLQICAVEGRTKTDVIWIWSVYSRQE